MSISVKAASITNEQIADDAGVLHTRNRLNRFDCAVVKVGPLRGGLKADGAESCIMRTRSVLNPESMRFKCHQLRTSKPAPASRTAASAKSATTSARRIRRVTAPPETPLLPSSPDEQRSVRRISRLTG